MGVYGNSGTTNLKMRRYLSFAAIVLPPEMGEEAKTLTLLKIRNNDVDKPVARHFNSVNHSISDIKVSFLKLEPLIPTGSMNDFRLFAPSIVSVFV